MKLKAVHVAERGRIVKSESDCMSELYPTIHCHYQDPVELLDVFVRGAKLTKLTDDILRIT
ncbi:hypothetical protein J8L86_20075 [Shewanella sp. MMG014]|nr:hypothetical protein [Shewanella sp. MMG014]